MWICWTAHHFDVREGATIGWLADQIHRVAQVRSGSRPGEEPGRQV